MAQNRELEIQESQYRFPYHHIVGEIGRMPSRAVFLKWGFEYRAYVEHLLQLVADEEPDTILEVGCGDGYLGASLLKSGYRYKGVDISGRAVRFAKAFGVETAYVHGDCSDVTEKFDLVILCEVLEHIEDPTPFLQEVAKKVAPGGALLVSVPSDVRPTHKKHFRHYSERSLLDQLSIIPGATVSPVRHFFVDNWFYRAYLSLLFNRYWSIDVKWLSALEWRFVKRRFARHVPGKGTHLVARVAIT